MYEIWLGYPVKRSWAIELRLIENSMKFGYEKKNSKLAIEALAEMHMALK